MKSELAHLGSRTVEYVYLSGKSRTVVFVNGSGGPLISWVGIVGQVAEDTSVLIYNRPGVGRSSAAELPQTATQMAQDLHELLSFLHIDGVVVLVGHSLGGLVVLQFCLSYPHLVSGLVLLEPSTIWDIDGEKNLPRDTKNPNGELNFVRESAAALRDLSSLALVPSVVALGVKPTLLYRLFRRRFEARRSNLRRLALELGPSQVVEFTKSGHFPQITEPKKVAELITDLSRSLAAKGQPEE